MGLRCLIVDDSDEFLASATALLTAEGLDIVATASTAEGAVELAGATRPDVALVDVQLGDEDGLEVAARLSLAAPATRVVLISTHAESDLAELIADSPAAGFLAKTSLSAGAVQALARLA